MPASRRTFLGAVSATAASYKRVLGANDRVQVGFIGFGLIGRQHVHDFKNQSDVDLAAMCDVYQPRLEQGVAACGQRARPYRDFRKLLDDKDLQAVVVSTPDHWHALLTIMACAAGKDVYVEKPLTLFVKEGRWMVEAARRYNRVVQVGTQQRSGRHYQHARRILQEGYIGKIMSVRMGSFRNIMPGFSNPPDGAAPSDFDYDMWLGPAPKRPYNPRRGLYHFRWFWDYSGGQMTNLGAHEIDIVHWVMGVKGPSAVASTGGRFALQGAGETPDTQDALFRYPGFTTVYSYREASAGRRLGYGMEFFGSKGGLVISRAGFEVFPDMKINPENAIPVFQGHPTGGPQREAEFKPEPWVPPMKEPGSSDEQFNLHVRNFVDCIKSRQRPIADVEGGHQVTTACHLANLSLRLGRELHWDPDKEDFHGDPEASTYLVRPYRKPWDDVLHSFHL
ncbi:MAG TPA: Gfo/Idh/MocA family oxidoreductase [Bryobacteraceae bacterium]|nr:Gfo/Idh/MocA family oxidoreductase [Bryobacteraceae bacterium]